MEGDIIFYVETLGWGIDHKTNQKGTGKLRSGFYLWERDLESICEYWQ